MASTASRLSNQINFLSVDEVVNFVAAKYYGDKIEEKHKYNVLATGSNLATVAMMVSVIAGGLLYAAAAFLVRYLSEQEIANKYYKPQGFIWYFSPERMAGVTLDANWQDVALKVLGINVLRNYIG